VLACAARCWPHLRLPTWDRMMLPLPFGWGVIALGPPFHPERGANVHIENAIDEVTRLADGTG
jgi:lysophospholipid acyltransferase (LPLAT)-like uncharacterized protein